jgi:uncharacterized protein YqjF (DUF2071 family)
MRGKLIGMSAFVTAHWTDLILLTYAVPDDAIMPFLGGPPPIGKGRAGVGLGLEIDRWNGQAYVSVVGFRFRRTRVFGLNPGLIIPAVADFPQWNLRAYVRSGDDLGIVFIKEFVPHPLIAGMVRGLYNENYHAAPLTTHVTDRDGVRQARYDLRFGGRRHSMSLITHSPAQPLQPGTADYFFAERYWGWAADHRGARFRVTHPPWSAFPVASYVVSIDFGLLYGDEWRFLNDLRPDYATWCDGSKVEVSWRIKSV